MRIIKCLSEQMEDEICGCIEYAKDALEYQISRPNLAKIYFQMAQVEFSHYATLHEQVVKIIQEVENQNITFPQWMRNK